LWEDYREATDLSGAAGVSQVEIALGNDGIYMTDWDGNILHAPADSSSSHFLFKSPVPGARLFGFDRDGNRLYFTASSIDTQTQRASSQIFGIDVATGESRILADLADTVIGAVAVVGSRFYVSNGYVTAIFTGPLDWDATAGIGDLKLCASISSLGQVAISNGTLLGIDVAQSLLAEFDLNTCSTTQVYPLATQDEHGYTSVLSAAEGRPYLQHCDWATMDCLLVRVAADGTLEPMASGYVNVSAGPAVTGENVYLIAKPVGGDEAQFLRLYTWGDNPNSPIALAAPLSGVSQLVVNAKYVYAVECTSDAADGIFESSNVGYTATCRVLRIRR